MYVRAVVECGRVWSSVVDKGPSVVDRGAYL